MQLDIDEDEDCQSPENLYVPSYTSPDSKYRIALRGYTGCVPIDNKWKEDEEELSPNTRQMIRGYSGHISGCQNIVGVPRVPSLEKQQKALDETNARKNNSSSVGAGRMAGHVQDKVEQSTLGSSFTNFRTYGAHMGLEERYNAAIQSLWKRGQTQQMLLRTVQQKLSERVNSYSQQHVRIRKIYEYFDLDGNGTLDEHEFRQFLELSNCYFDDVQSLALYAYFDQSRSGAITWEDFEAHAMVFNPRGGTAVLPKAITATMNSDDWKSVAKTTSPNFKATRK